MVRSARLRPSLQASIVTVFASLFVASAGITAWYSYSRSSAHVLELSAVIVDQVSQAVQTQTVGYLEPVGKTAQLIAGRTDAAAARATRPALVRYLVNTLDTHPHFYGAYVGFADGSFVQLVNVPTAVGRGRFPDAPPETTRALRLILRGADEPSERFEYLDAEGNLVGSHDRSPTYDPRKRPWYDRAARSEEVTWSEYIFDSSHQPGLTAAFAVHDRDGDLIGVAAADIELGALSSFLADQRVGNSGVAFVVDTEHQLIAYPDAERIVTRDEGAWRSVKIDELGLPWLDGALERWGGGAQPEQFTLDVGGVSYMALFRPLPASSGQEWAVGVVVPIDDYLGSLKHTNRNSLLFAFAVLAVGLLTVTVVGRWIARPIRALADEARRMTAFDLDGEIEASSLIKEVEDLQRAMGTMKVALNDFGKFVPKELVEELLRQGGGIELGGERRDMVVLFTDVQGFTGTAESADAEALALQLTEYFTELTGVLREHGAVIDKFIGDAIMAFWGAPRPDPHAATNACRAVVRAKDRLEALQRRWTDEGRLALPTGFGVHFGEAIVGTIGSSERMNYTVLGDTVNLASRVEGLTRMYGVRACVTDAVRTAAGEGFLYRPLDVVAVKGRRGGVKLHALMTERPATAEQERLAALSDTGLTAYLERRWDDALAAFDAILTEWPTDRTAARMRARCEDYRTDPPGSDWTGVYEHNTK